MKFVVCVVDVSISTDKNRSPHNVHACDEIPTQMEVHNMKRTIRNSTRITVKTQFLVQFPCMYILLLAYYRKYVSLIERELHVCIESLSRPCYGRRSLCKSDP